MNPTPQKFFALNTIPLENQDCGSDINISYDYRCKWNESCYSVCSKLCLLWTIPCGWISKFSVNAGSGVYLWVRVGLK